MSLINHLIHSDSVTRDQYSHGNLDGNEIKSIIDHGMR